MDDLISAALAKLRSEQEAWAEIVQLQTRGDQNVYDKAVILLEQSDPAARELALIVLRELGPNPKEGERPFRDDTVQLIMDRIGQEEDVDVLGWMISALGYHGAHEAISLIGEFARSDSPILRFRAAAALPYLSRPGETDPVVVESLELLTRDPDADIRYYALHGLQEMGLAADQTELTLATLQNDADSQIRQLAVDYSLPSED